MGYFRLGFRLGSRAPRLSRIGAREREKERENRQRWGRQERQKDGDGGDYLEVIDGVRPEADQREVCLG